VSKFLKRSARVSRASETREIRGSLPHADLRGGEWVKTTGLNRGILMLNCFVLKRHG
jgi:hypothetical protein